MWFSYVSLCLPSKLVDKCLMWFIFLIGIFLNTKDTKGTKGFTKGNQAYVFFLCALLCLMWFNFLTGYFPLSLTLSVQMLHFDQHDKARLSLSSNQPME
jgi:hypothetical protein